MTQLLERTNQQGATITEQGTIITDLGSDLVKEQRKSDDLQRKSDDLQRKSDDLQRKSDDLRLDLNEEQEKSDDLRHDLEKEEEKSDGLRRDLEKETAKRIEDVDALRELTLLITPLHLRVLLEHARVRILDQSNCNSWEDLRGNKTIYELTSSILDTLRDFPHCPSRDTIQFLCSYNNVRRAGNVAAHTASQDDIKAAVTTKGLGTRERECLEQIYGFLYNGQRV